ncbi:MAG: hypothetical protein WC606_03625 [Candidatus Absconditabacterales bacterium]
MEQTQQHQKKHFSEEATLDKVEKKIDHNMEKIMNKGFVQKFLNLKIVKDILGAHFVNDINHKLQPYLKTIFTIVGRISLITGIIGIFSFLISLSGLGFMFSLGFGIGLRVSIYVLLAIAFSVLSLFTGIGMIRFKKRVTSLVILGFAVSVLSFIISFIPVGLYSYKSYGSFGGNFFNLLITFILLILILKNENMFKN